jgi:hypothetical protein
MNINTKERENTDREGENDSQGRKEIMKHIQERQRPRYG